jgi:hypothetical protein
MEWPLRSTVDALLGIMRESRLHDGVNKREGLGWLAAWLEQSLPLSRLITDIMKEL